MKYKNYYNYETGNRNIYSRSNLLNMTVQDLFDNELPLAYQFNTIGIPDDDELEMSPNTHKFVDEKGITRWGVNDGTSPIQHGLGGTTEEMLERERLQNQQAEMNQQMNLPTETVRPSVSGIQDDIAPVPEIAPTPINISMDKFGKVVDKAKETLLPPKSRGDIIDSNNKVILSERSMDSKSPIKSTLEDLWNGANTSDVISDAIMRSQLNEQNLLERLGTGIKNGWHNLINSKQNIPPIGESENIAMSQGDLVQPGLERIKVTDFCS